MKLETLHIKNFRACRDVRIELAPVISLVGANNAGKSTVLRALDFLFNPSVAKLNEESFWALDTKLQIWVEGLFGDLSPNEVEIFEPYLRPDRTLQIARSAQYESEKEDTLDLDIGSTAKIKISQHYCKQVPTYDWLNPPKISGVAINDWWDEKEKLVVKGHKFTELAGTAKPTVGDWKDKAAEFAEKYLAPDDYEDFWDDNPQGYAGVLKGRLPHFILIPAVRDLTDETKTTKTNPLGQLLFSVLNEITPDQNQSVTESLQEVEKILNRSGGSQRISSIAETEQRLNTLIQEQMECDIEIEFQTPTFNDLLTTPHIYADDGFRNLAENKGHGLQRAIIFSIIRCYSELVTGRGEKKARSMILAVEEPELYMHPQAQRTIRRVFHTIAEGGDQVVFSTHSGLLLDVADFDEIIRVEALPYKHEGRKTVMTRVWQLSMDEMLEDLRVRHPEANATPSSQRELYSNAYHPARSEGFFAKRLILVEGATEEYSLPIYADAIGSRLDSLNVAVIDCGGKGPIDRLYRVFNELGIPCYLVFDYDKDSTDEQTINKSRELLQLCGLSPDPPTQFSASERVACFPTKWELQMAAEIPDLDKLTAQARHGLGLSPDSGKPLVARYIASKLVTQQPPNIPPSIAQILENALKVEWIESCLERAEPGATDIRV